MSEVPNDVHPVPLPFMYHATVELSLSCLTDHPLNRRATGINRAHVDTLKMLIQQYGYNTNHPLIVRTLSPGYQIIEGHHRRRAAAELGYSKLPCIVEDLDDVEANLRLLVSNEQQGNDLLDVGMNALETVEKARPGRNGLTALGVRGYARRLGRDPGVITRAMAAAEVYKLLSHDNNFPTEGIFRQLAEIHPAPQWLWSALVTKLLAEEWTVERTRDQVKRVQQCPVLPAWVDHVALAKALVDGEIFLRHLPQFTKLVDDSLGRIARAEEDAERFTLLLHERLTRARPSRLSDVEAICKTTEAEQRAIIDERQQADFFRTRREEEIAARIARLRRHVSLTEWETLAIDEQETLLHLSPQEVEVGHFNEQESTDIEWAQFSWNPVTGCLHNCPYCYARDIAQKERMAKAYPFGFAPMLRPGMLLAPRQMMPPDHAATDTRYRNVFTCSMADLFGRWVPASWIEAVLREIRHAPQWNFLCLTKFPKRAIEFDLPPNAWMGTTVDLQARVKAAEDAFAHITAGVRWLSIEPLLEPLQFQHLERFDWMVIGGASASSQTPEWHPPFAWVEDLLWQARDAGCKVYFKTNLLRKRLLEMPFDAPITDENAPAPAEFRYLKTVD